MPKPKFSDPTNTFVIRIWREWSIDQQIWRGNIEHLESEQREGFGDFERILAFLRSFGIFDEEEQKNDGENWR
ncbi:MAG: hypothetical protein HN560_03930 [Anaerolineae bacterium]|nr:hypothetical protein [Anaerolineae bacterium]